MSPLEKAAVILLVIAFVLTGVAGMMDMTYNEFQLTRQHLWNDGLFLGLVAIAVLLFDMRHS
jgi:hypothetical protein